MKIEQIRFKNLNSLYGEWDIDLTLPEYQNNGIFAITGATGAGKSTILDAICLALYGSTPRLQNISKSSNEIMSRQTWECFAEVTFRVKSDRYRCNWSQRRAYKKADGTLSESKHEVSNPDTGEILESKKRDVATFIIDKTGMDLDRFTRSILLAQGGFSAFLKATPDERGPILEQITGTGIYSDISIKIHQKQREENEKYQLLIAESSGITFLSEIEEEELREQLKNKSLLESELLSKSKDLSDQIVWKNRLVELKNDIKNINLQMVEVRLKEEAFRDKKEKLNLGIRSDKLLGDYNLLQQVTNLQKTDEVSLINIKEKLISQTQIDLQNKKQFREIEQNLKENKFVYQQESEIINKVRKLDFEIDRKREDITKEELALSKTECEISNYLTDKNKLNNKLSELKNENIKVDKYILENNFDNTLTKNIDMIIQLNETLESKNDEIYFTKIKLENQKQKIIEISKKNIMLLDSLKEVKNVIKSNEKNIEIKNEELNVLLNNKLKREYSSELTTLIREKSLHVKIASLEDERSKLLDGSPCPLCGSEHHPYALGNTPKIEEIDNKIIEIEFLLNNIDKIELDLGVLLRTQTLESEKLNALEKESIKIETELNSDTIESKRLKDELNKHEFGLIELEQSLLLKLKPYNILELTNKDMKVVVKNLIDRESLWAINLEKQNNYNTDKLSIENDIDKLSSMLDMKQKEKLLFIENLSSFNKQLTELLNSRGLLYGNKNPDLEEKKLQDRINQSELELENLRRVVDKSSHLILEGTTLKDSLEKSILDRSSDIKSRESNFLKRCKEVGFISFDDFIMAIIPPDELNSLSALSENIERHITELTNQLKDRVATLSREEALNKTSKSLDILQAEYNVVIQQARNLGEELGGLKSNLNNSLKNKQIVEHRLKDIELQKIEVENWQKLHTLIGSADGKKYRNFAQGLTFEQMVGHANRELVKMSDRYLLIRDSQNPLELNVIDNYQAGEIRSTKNLSGGESFIISLALALGLSNMASNKVRVDSLFLDEGFGTLDEEALETALETLSTLHQHGKLIGIISHIPALKERISTQINIVKTSGGRGKIFGPGCKSV